MILKIKYLICIYALFGVLLFKVLQALLLLVALIQLAAVMVLSF